MKDVETQLFVRKMSSVKYDFKKNPPAAGYWGGEGRNPLYIIIYFSGSAVCNHKLFIYAWPKIRK